MLEDGAVAVMVGLMSTGGPVRALVEPALERRGGFGRCLTGSTRGVVGVARLRRVLAGVELPRAVDGRIVLAVGAMPPRTR